MISAVAPGTVGRGIGRAGGAPMPAPPEPPVGVGAGLGAPLGVLCDELPPAEVAPPPVLALALGAAARSKAAKLGRIRWVTRKRVSFVAYGVS